jgi:hypothetical protein
MLRRSSTLLFQQNGRGRSTLYRSNSNLISSLLLSRTAVLSSHAFSKSCCNIRNKIVVNSCRRMSTEAPQPERPQAKKDDDDEDETAVMLTPGQKVVVASRLALWTGVAIFAGICGYYIFRELVPT